MDYVLNEKTKQTIFFPALRLIPNFLILRIMEDDARLIKISTCRQI